MLSPITEIINLILATLSVADYITVPDGHQPGVYAASGRLHTEGVATVTGLEN